MRDKDSLIEEFRESILELVFRHIERDDIEENPEYWIDGENQFNWRFDEEMEAFLEELKQIEAEESMALEMKAGACR
jgi:hypothetical protein